MRNLTAGFPVKRVFHRKMKELTGVFPAIRKPNAVALAFALAVAQTVALAVALSST
ncbi:hypothetical protein [Paenibacillus sp. Soil766]|uniref:hypothetical protein n=1 Tax=Paenibacillus sp. Soil766 TaxID=1736404 RepID=UPI000ACEB070|nr:hypothetical protein [Paenibacillus sp. Soil766]